MPIGRTRVKPAILTAFFVSRDDAVAAYRSLRRAGFRRAALVHKSAAGRIETRTPMLRRGPPRSMLAEHSRWLVNEESVIVLQAPIVSLRRPVTMLRECGETPPVVFFLNPGQPGLLDDLGAVEAPQPRTELRERARDLAAAARTGSGSARNATLLNRLRQSRDRVKPVFIALSEAETLGQRMTPIVEWILDNQYLLESTVLDVQQNLPRHFYRELPVVETEPHRGLPRAYGLARQLVVDTGSRMDKETIVEFVDAYQSVQTLTTAELWAIPQMLRITLVECVLALAGRGLTELRDREIADFWANRLITAGRRDPVRLFPMMAELTAHQSSPSPYFGFQLLEHLYGEEAPAKLVRSWLEQIWREPLDQLAAREQDRQTKEQIAVANAFTSIRELVRLDWRDVFEEVSPLEAVLRRDPAGVYAEMDYATRDRYRRRIEQTARRSELTEEVVALRAIELAERASGTTDGDATGGPDRTHVGSYLVGAYVGELNRHVGASQPAVERMRDWVSRHHAAVYLSGLAIALVLLVGLIDRLGLLQLALPVRVLFALIAVIPVSQLAVEIVNYLVMRAFPPRALAKMDFEHAGIPDAFRTLVVVPMMLTDVPTIVDQVSKLEVRYLANREKNLLFSLFSDYTDADHPQTSDDESLLNAAIAALETLNERHGGERFLLFHRGRVWSESERKYIGWERKRGKLEELNRLIDGTRADHADRLVYVGDADWVRGVRFVITLDGDTQLPGGTARRMIETLAHPLNQPRFDADGRIAAGSYGIIQPRVSPSLPSSSGSRFSRLFSYAVGVDPYTSVVSDANHDLTGEGSYHGKGIYDVRAFSRVLSGRFPDETVLSHDLIEGAHVRVALASDIELLDEFPQEYSTFAARQHRWIRGDWQIAGWTMPRVVHGGEGRVRNPLSCFDRWKILDNLRRSLVPAANLSLLALAWFADSPALLVATIVVAAQLLFATIAPTFTMATTRRGLSSLSVSRIGHDVMRALAEASLIPHQSLLAADAIIRVWYRRLVSRRNLLEWSVRQSGRLRSLTNRSRLLLSMGAIGSLCAAAAGAVLLWSPVRFAFAAPWLVLWTLSPLTGWLLSPRRGGERRVARVPAADRRYLRGIARRTWRYWSQFVTEETSWLPPDNYQVSHQDRLAMRTSPTNIGLWVLSVPAARRFGYVTTDQAIDVLGKSMRTIGRLERFEGHLLNWYDIANLQPLEPRYVSTVDSGNLLGALWSLGHGLEEMLADPVIDGAVVEGLYDTAELLRQAIASARSGGQGLVDDFAEEISRAFRTPAGGIAGTLALLRRIEPTADALVESVRGTTEEAVYWAGQLRDQVSAWTLICDRYLRWTEIMSEIPEHEIETLGDEAAQAVRAGLEQAPSIRDLAAGAVPCIRLLLAARRLPDVASGGISGWIDQVAAAFSDAQWLAGEQLAAGEALIAAVDELAGSINMRFLYDSRRKLFTIGFSVAEQRRENAFYDLLASEARLGSFVAIARGEIPMEHWFTMGRPYTAIRRRRVLLSWTGTMFEYLMPLLLMRSYGKSLLDKAARDAVTVQIGYGRKRRVPWGISESAYSDLDGNRTYQYKAFGVPRLGLKRGLEEELVVAPYASMLALHIAPKRAVRNLRRLESMGLLEQYGFYDAIDFTRQANRDGKRGVLVRTYMSHHAGMGFLSLHNHLHEDAARNSFHRDARVRAFEPLLHESIPAISSRYLATRGYLPVADEARQIAPSVSRFESPTTATPKTQLLGNGRYSLMITNSGGGYSQWGDLEITRWRADPTRDSGGVICYVHEPDARRLWANTYHPAGGRADEYDAEFASDRAVIRRLDNGIELKTDVVVSNEDDVEVRRITLINRSFRARKLELSSYIELSLAPHRTDLQHPAFNKLFIQTEAVPTHHALIAFRRSRRADEEPVYVAHRLTSDEGGGGEGDELRFETDRREFIGRGRTLEDPAGARREPACGQGYVLDPILSIRTSVTLEPGERRQISLIVAASASREAVLSLMTKYDDPRAVDRAMDYAWASAQIELRALRIQPDEARRFQQIASYLLFPSPRLRPPAQRILENRKGQSSLWPYGISGDVPILLVTIAEARDLELIRQILRAHSYWKSHGFAVDLVILNEEASGYELVLRSRLEELVRAHPGGAYLLSADQIPPDDVSLLMASSRVVLVAARGALPQQMGLAAEVPEPAALTPKRRTANDTATALPFMELHYFNGIGGFTDCGREYAIYIDAGANTPAPWVNVIANPSFGTLVSETGAGFTWYGNSQRNRLTEWSNDPVVDPPCEALYVRDDESGAYWNPTASPKREDSAYRARHGAGYSVFEHNSHGIEQELTVLVPMGETGGDPIKLQRLKLRNSTTRSRTISVTHYVEWTLGENRESTQMHVATSWDREVDALLARNRYHPEYGDRVAFTALTPGATSHSGDRRVFVGRNRSLAQPAAMERSELSSRVGAGLDPCAAQQTVLELDPGATVEVVCMLGQADSTEHAHQLIRAFRRPGSFDAALDRTRAWWDELLGTIEVRTPEAAANFLVNRWLLYQSVSCRMWGRSATYQSGGAYGYRDQLQDAMGLVYARPEMAREQILIAASRQFVEGDVQHWWHPPSGAGIRSRISDDLLWLPYVVAHYVRVSGDRAILDEHVPFLVAPVLQDEQHEVFSTPEISSERATLFEHCRRAVERGLTSGPHGLPLMGTGDWNDGMNLVGAGGTGESVWLGWFLVGVLRAMEELADASENAALGRSFARERDALASRIESSAWDGEWYLRAFFDDGTPLGSSASREARIDSLPQSWARLSGAGDEERTHRALESAWRHLVREDDALVLLFEPPFDTSDPSPGYIRGYPPGVRENGGQYTHAALWFAMAMARGGDGERAAGMLRLLNPIERARDPDSVRRYGVEPYVVAADVYLLPGRTGHGGWSWYTGSAAWMYRAWLEEVLGLEVRNDLMRFRPVIPRWWDGFEVRYRHGQALYEIDVVNPDGVESGVAWIELDGRRLPALAIPLERNAVTHRVLVQMGERALE